MGYNGVLCAIALGGKSWMSCIWAVCSVLLSVVLQIVGMNWGIITLTAPFVLSVWLTMGIKNLSPFQIRQKASHQPQQRHKGTYIINSLYTIFICHTSQYSRSNTGNSKAKPKTTRKSNPTYWVAIPGHTAIWQEKRKKASDRHRSSALLSMQAPT